MKAETLFFYSRKTLSRGEMKNSISTFKNASNISWVSGVKKYFFLVDYRGFPIAQTVKNLHAMWETQV